MANKKENKNVQEITVKIEGQEWKDALDKAFEKANKKAKIDGFRPGKAPKDVFPLNESPAAEILLQDEQTKKYIETIIK